MIEILQFPHPDARRWKSAKMGSKSSEMCGFLEWIWIRYLFTCIQFQYIFGDSWFVVIITKFPSTLILSFQLAVFSFALPVGINFFVFVRVLARVIVTHSIGVFIFSIAVLRFSLSFVMISLFALARLAKQKTQQS